MFVSRSDIMRFLPFPTFPTCPPTRNTNVKSTITSFCFTSHHRLLVNLHCGLKHSITDFRSSERSSQRNANCAWTALSTVHECTKFHTIIELLYIGSARTTKIIRYIRNHTGDFYCLILRSKKIFDITAFDISEFYRIYQLLFLIKYKSCTMDKLYF